MPDLETSLTYCTYCPKLCRHTCPVATAEARETVVPQQMMATMRLVRHATPPPPTPPRDEPHAHAHAHAHVHAHPHAPDDPGGVLGHDSTPPPARPPANDGGDGDDLHAADRDRARALYGCTGCLACTTACHHGITPGIHLFTGRADAERQGLGHPALAGLPERVRATALRTAREARDALPPGRADLTSEVAFFPGCEEPAAARAALALLDRATPPDGGALSVALAATTLGCGGYPLLAGGFPEHFRLHAERVARDLAGYRRVIVHCAACAWTMKTQYAPHGVPLAPEIVHTVEHLDELAAEGRLPAARPSGEAFYHDPCYLGRHQRLFDGPRRLAARAFAHVHEFSRARDEAECSGGGGVLPLTMPTTAAAIASARLAEVKEAGVRTVVTGCPTCKRQLTREGVVARDLVDVLLERSDAE